MKIQCGGEFFHFSIAVQQTIPKLGAPTLQAVAVVYFVHESAICAEPKGGGWSLLRVLPAGSWRTPFPWPFTLSPGCLCFLRSWRLGPKNDRAKRTRQKGETVL